MHSSALLIARSPDLTVAIAYEWQQRAGRWCDAYRVAERWDCSPDGRFRGRYISELELELLAVVLAAADIAGRRESFRFLLKRRTECVSTDLSAEQVF